MDDLEDQIRAWVEALDLGEPVTADEARARAIEANERRRHDRLRRRVVVAAAVVVLLGAGGGLLVRSGDDDAVTAGRPTTTPLRHDLDELADRVAVLPATVLGETTDARYTYRRRVVSSDRPMSEVTSQVEQQWVALDGSGRQIITEDDAAAPTDMTAAPGTLEIGGLAPHVFVGLTDDVDAVAAAFGTYTDLAFDSQVSAGLVDVLSYTGLPGPARAGLLRALDHIGMVAVPGADVGPNLLRVEGPGPDGSRVEADIDLRTGLVVAWATYDLGSGATGEGITRFTSIEVDLRRDTQGS